MTATLRISQLCSHINWIRVEYIYVLVVVWPVTPLIQNMALHQTLEGNQVPKKWKGYFKVVKFPDNLQNALLFGGNPLFSPPALFSITQKWYWLPAVDCQNNHKFLPSLNPHPLRWGLEAPPILRQPLLFQSLNLGWSHDSLSPKECCRSNIVLVLSLEPQTSTYSWSATCIIRTHWG